MIPFDVARAAIVEVDIGIAVLEEFPGDACASIDFVDDAIADVHAVGAAAAVWIIGDA